MAAVDLARVRQPVHVEAGRAEEEEAETVEAELRRQAAAVAVDEQYGSWQTTTRAQAGHMLTAQELPEPAPQVS